MSAGTIYEPLRRLSDVLLAAAMTGVGLPIEPGQRVRHPGRPDWGIGQVQSAIGGRVTVNFPHAGKVLINAEVVALDIIEAAPRSEFD